MHRSKLLWIAVLVVSSFVSNAFGQCRSDDRQSYDITQFYGGGDRDLAGYGIILQDARNPSCAASAANALQKKIRNTLAAGNQYDNVVGLVGPYQGWLQGANVSLIFAAALQLSQQGKLTKPLDDLLLQINYQMNLDPSCGFDNHKWKNKNSCMDDYAIGASAFAWQAAYAKKRNRSSYTGLRDAANGAIDNALSEQASICLYIGTQPGPVGTRGPCIGNVWDYRVGNAEALGLHGGDAMPYGVGLMTSIASAAVALELMGEPLVLNDVEKDMATALRVNGRAHTDVNGNSFNTNCITWQGTDGYLTSLTRNYACREPGYGTMWPYHPMMFPVKKFYDKYIWIDSNAWAFDGWDETRFCSNWGTDEKCAFFHPGRREVYKTIANDWTQTPPTFSGQFNNYTVTFRTGTNHYLSARYGGGSDVNAQATSAITHEKFTLVDLNGGTLNHGDLVTLQAANGLWVAAENGGNSAVNADRTYPHEWETFTIHKTSGTGQIVSGNTVALRTYYGYYVSAVNGGGSTVNTNVTAIGTWEAFTLGLTYVQ